MLPALFKADAAGACNVGRWCSTIVELEL